MDISINAIVEGREIIEDFAAKLKANNIEIPWKEGDELPMGCRILVKNKDNKDIEIPPSKLKIVFDKE